MVMETLVEKLSIEDLDDAAAEAYLASLESADTVPCPPPALDEDDDLPF